MHLLDTDTLTHLYASSVKVAERLKTLEDSIVGTTIITRIELLRGRIDYLLKAETGADLLKAQTLLARTEDLLAQILIVPFNASAAEQFERLCSVRSLGKMGRADLLIASIALAHRATLVTRNLRHFRPVPGLAVVNWVDYSSHAKINRAADEQGMTKNTCRQQITKLEEAQPMIARFEKSLISLNRHIADYRPQLEQAIRAIETLQSTDSSSEEFSQALADLHVAATVLEPYSEGIVEAIDQFTEDRPD